MKYLNVYVGIPASGKSTCAKRMTTAIDNMIRVNRDDIRSLTIGAWSKIKENLIIDIRNEMIKQGIRSGYEVIVDDTNLERKTIEDIRKIARELADELKEDVSLCITVFKIDVEEAVKRDSLRPNPVGRAVIEKMHKRFIENGWDTVSQFEEVYSPNKVEQAIIDPELPKAIICDIDGTLCLFGDKNPYARDFENDLPNEAVVKILTQYSRCSSSDNIIFVSGRLNKYRSVTEEWIKKHVPAVINNPANWYLYMRNDGDKRKDTIVKEEIFNRIINGRYYIDFVLDDRKSVCDQWRAKGLTCFQVAEGDF